MVKSKICKWSKCGKVFLPLRPFQNTCNNTMCALGYVKEKESLKQAKADKELIKAFKTNIKKLSDYKKDLQISINKIVRLIDKGHPCISSGRSNYTCHAGHFYSVGSHENLRFNLLNIWGQSDSDNTHKSGNELEFRKGLIKTFGIELIDEIDELEVKYSYLGLRKDAIIESNFVARRIIKELEESNKYFTTEERLIYRKIYNNRLGIYD